MTAYQNLRSIVADDTRFCRFANSALAYAAQHRTGRTACLHSFAEWAQNNYAVRAEVHDTCVMLYCTAGRGKQPACIVVSVQVGQRFSPSADFIKSGAHAVVQVFDAGADDNGLADISEAPSHWVEAEGRLLRH